MDEAEENSAEDQPPDKLGQVLVDAQREWNFEGINEVWDDVEGLQKIIVSKLQARTEKIGYDTWNAAVKGS